MSVSECVFWNTLKRELRAEERDKGTGDLVAKCRADGSGTSVWHPVACFLAVSICGREQIPTVKKVLTLGFDRTPRYAVGDIFEASVHVQHLRRRSLSALIKDKSPNDVVGCQN